MADRMAGRRWSAGPCPGIDHLVHVVVMVDAWELARA
jgi:hypothetical protein